MRLMKRHRGAAAGLLAGAILAAAGSASAQYPNEDLPIPDTPRKDLTAIQRTFAPPAPPPLTVFPELREQWKDTPAFLRDSKFDINFRSYYRDEVTNAPNSVGIKEAWAGGGSVSAETGRLFDVVSLGAVLYTSFPIVAPPDHGNTGLLLPNQQGYAVFGQLYGRARLFETHYATVGRYLYDTPFLGPHDNRMTPNTFFGYTLTGTFGSGENGGPTFRYGGGWLGAIKPRDAIDFQSMASKAGAPNSNAGVGLLGGLLTWGPASIGAIEYYSEDILNIFYSEAKYGVSFGDSFNAIAAAQFVAQNSTGQNLPERWQLLRDQPIWHQGRPRLPNGNPHGRLFDGQSRLRHPDAVERQPVLYRRTDPGFQSRRGAGADGRDVLCLHTYRPAGCGCVGVLLQRLDRGARRGGAVGRDRVGLQSRVAAGLETAPGALAARTLRH